MGQVPKMLFPVLLSVLALVPAQGQVQKLVFVVESYHAEYGWDASYRKALVAALGNGYRTEFFEMDTKRVPADQFPRMSDLAWKQYLALKPDLVVLGDDPAMKFLAGRLAETATPVVFLGINNNPRAYLPKNAGNFTGVLERPLLMRSILNIQEMIPAARKVLVLFDTSVTAQIVKKESFQDKDAVMVRDVQVELRLLGTRKEWQDTVLAAQGKFDACVVGLYQTVSGPDGKPLDAEELLRWVSKNTPVPPFAFWDFAVGPAQTVGGLVLYGKDMGNLAAGLVRKILEEGKTPESLVPLIADEGQYLFSKTQLAKWKLTVPRNLAASAALVE